ncbi:FAD-binding dehydrogenase [Gordonia lacunae]|uniref:FAD-binding dehydrogenase n=1 Tax=Gordonia lacunae TaxID=417102 RepID=UPI0039E58C30
MADADVIVVGAGLAGLVAATELAEAGKRVLIVDQEPQQSLGGQAFWSLGGLFMVGTPEQRRMGIKDSVELAWQDWIGSAGFDRGTAHPGDDDYWGRQWARAYVEFAAGEKRAWLRKQGVRWAPIVGWAERGGYLAEGHGNSVPRFHVTWGTGPGVLAPFDRRARDAESRGQIRFGFRHRVDHLSVTNGVVDGVSGALLEPSAVNRGVASSRREVGRFDYTSQAVLVTSGGIGGNHDLVRANWPARLGSPPQSMLSGVPAHVDGQMVAVAETAGARAVNQDRMWHYTEGVQNWGPIWDNHGIRIIPGPSSLWLDARGQRLPAPNFPGFDTLGTLAALRATGYEYSWFVSTQKVMEKELVLSGSEQNPDLTDKDLRSVIARLLPGAPEPVRAFTERGIDFIVADTITQLVERMNEVAGRELVETDDLQRQIAARDRELDNPFTKDLQVSAIHNSRRSRGERWARTAVPHKFGDPRSGPLVAVRLHVITRKTLGGLQTDLGGRVLGTTGKPVPGLWAAGEVAGFGGGGVHGYRSLEGTFLGGCLFSGRQSGRALADTL